MAYDEELAVRVRTEVEDQDDLVEKRMFGGLAFLISGNMACGVTGDSLLVRLPPEESEAALSEPATRPFDMTGRPMKGWVLVDSAGVSEDDALGRWVARGVAFARTLPPK